MTEQHLITREIGVDMGHRVTYHGSKCRNLHGHRYTVQATCKGPLYMSGEQQGMVLDFGFLKEEMMNEIDTPCDHGMCLWIEDPFVRVFMDDTLIESAYEVLNAQGYVSIRLPQTDDIGGKFYLVPFVPTAEHLAKHWFDRLAPVISKRTDGQATLANIKVWETPNCSAEYPGLKG